MSVPDMYECPTAPKAVHTAANIAARVARSGAGVPDMAETCSHGPRLRQSQGRIRS
ncbi:hypothetical protein GCM10017778_40940 [Streptomyces vinaceus]|nr:hypothetical protein GCM10017778_40940 [Streptomyces vinaceus]